MENFLKRTWMEVYLDRLEHNISLLRERAGKDCALMAVVKADAYGHGDRVMAKELERLGIGFFGVSNLEEALSLRKAGIQGEILILGVTPPETAPVLAAQEITQTVFAFEYAEALNSAAEAAGVQVKAHLKIDSGMGRIGFPHFIGGCGQEECDATAELLRISRFPGLRIEGIFSHFSVADALDEASSAYTNMQRRNFDDVVTKLQKSGMTFPYIHIQNSAGILNLSDGLCNMARMGISMYGLAPSGPFGGMLPVQPLMELKTAVAMVKDIPAGRSVSYGRDFVSGHPMKIATVPVGYADGYPRLLSGKASMLLRGKRVPVLGKVCMDQLMLDVTEVPQTKPGDVVTVFGHSDGAFLPVEELAKLAGTINYELVCGISRRVPRVYIRNGKPVETVDYILSAYPDGAEA